MRTRVKICGITNSEDANVAVDAGADALGMVFYEPSPRYIALEKASAVARTIPAFVSLVGLFVNADKNQIETVLNAVSLQLIQFHGYESPEFCESFGVPYIKALRVGSEGGLSGDELIRAIDSHKEARGILLDTYQKGTPGGTGERFDWDLIPQGYRHLILAGGLTPDNVYEAISTTKPYAVDVSGGVESSPGIKDAAKVQAFIEQAAKAS